MEKAILVGLNTPATIDFESSMAELANLAIACNVEVVGTLTQRLPSPTSHFYIGPGKVDELKEQIATLDANMVVFDDELSPSHIRNLEKALEIKVIDRTILILDIFASRAKTREAMIQVELAQSQYMLPRVVGLHNSFSRQRSGTGSKGPGEQQIELDRRILRDNITKLKVELKTLVQVRRTQRERRKKDQIPTIALAGYTNAGKSSVLNQMLTFSINNQEKYVFEKNMLFATLETMTRNIVLSNNHSFLLTDTVGFISRLPHHLIDAFKSTLEEIKEASLILHVIDFSNPEYKKQIAIVNEVLKSIDVVDVPVIYVFNKIDLCPGITLENYHPNAMVSALNGAGFNYLIDMIDKTIFIANRVVNMIIPFDQGQIYHILQNKCEILSTDYQEDGIHVKVSLNEELYNRYHEYLV